MNQIVAPVPTEISTPASQSATIGSGQTVPQGGISKAGGSTFSSVIAQTQTAGQNPLGANTPTAGKTSSPQNFVQGPEENNFEQFSGAISSLSSPAAQDPLFVSSGHANFVAVIDDSSLSVAGDESSVPIPSPALAGGTSPGHVLSNNLSEGTTASTGIRAPSSESFITSIVNHLDPRLEEGSNAGSGLPVHRQSSGSTRSGIIESPAPPQVLNDEILQPSPELRTTVSGTVRARVAGLANTPVVDSSEALSIEGFTRPSQHVLSSYVNIPHLSPVGRGNGVDNGTGDIAAKLNTRIESDGALKGELASSALHGEDTDSQEFGLDRGSQQRGDPSLFQQRATHLSSSGAASVFADVLGEGSSSELGPISRFGMVGERPVGLPSSSPQRLQMDVTLADQSRMQIDVAVQQRQVSAHLVVDQSLLRNLAVQNEGQLVGQLADAGLELKNFGAHISDHSASGSRQTRDESQNGSSDRDGRDLWREDSSRGIVPGMLIEHGLHFVA